MQRTSDIKRMLKRGVRRVIGRSRWHQWLMPRDALIVLTYHRILPDGHADLELMQPGMVVREHTFAMHLALLREHFRLISLSEWIELSRCGRPLPERACAITFDDGWRDNYETAFPLLRREDMPASIFLVADFVGTRRHFWPERLAAVLQRASAPGATAWSRPELSWLPREVKIMPAAATQTAAMIDAAIDFAKTLPDETVERHVDGMERALGIDAGQRRPMLLDWRHLADMAGSGLIQFGSHTRTHRRLDDADEDTLAKEVAESRERLRHATGQSVDVFCYPNGDTSAAAETWVRRHYAGACLTRRGWNRPRGDVHRLHRISLHQDISNDPDSFLARLSGWV